MSGRPVGGVGAGCAGLSLVGLLVGVGLTVWLGSRVLDATDPSSTPADPGEDSAVTLAVEPGSEVTDGMEVRVTVSGAALVPVEVTTCATLTGPSEPPRCSEGPPVSAAPGPDLRPTAIVVVERFIVVDGTEVDCARAPGTCALVASTPDEPVAATAPLTFAPD